MSKEPIFEIHITRRSFITSLLTVSLAAVTAPFFTSCGYLIKSTQAAAISTTAKFGGDDFSICHAVRDGKAFNRSSPSKYYDVVVIGTGISGLAAAWHLRDTDLLLLEKDPKIGGTAKRESWLGQYYSIGAAYMNSPSSTFAAIFKDLNLNPIELQKPDNSLFWKGETYHDVLGEGVSDLPFGKDAVASFKEAWKIMRDLSNQPDIFPSTPLEETTPKSLEFDTFTFKQFLSKFHPKVTEFIDLYVRSSWGVDSSKISAFAGLNFFSSEFSGVYAFPGGNAVLCETLAEHLQECLVSSAFVSRVEQKGNKVEVTYVKNGMTVTVLAKGVVIAAPKYIAARILHNMPDVYKDLFRSMRYGAYMVGAVLTRKALYRNSYDVWHFDKIFTDCITADWVLKGTKDDRKTDGPSVLTLYMPVGEHDGRNFLLATSYEDIIKRVRKDLLDIFPEKGDLIEDIRLFRWGHPMLIAYPGFLSKKLLVAPKKWGRIFFAHSDMQGLPSIEAAFYAGYNAALSVKELFMS